MLWAQDLSSHKSTGIKCPAPPRFVWRDRETFPRWYEYTWGNLEGPGHFLRGRVNQCVLMEGLDTPCPSESVPVPLKRLPLPRNESVSGRAFNACEAPSQGKNGELVQWISCTLLVLYFLEQSYWCRLNSMLFEKFLFRIYSILTTSN